VKSLRSVLFGASLAVLVMLVAGTAYALYGAHPIHGPVPTHFNLAGQADAWGSPQTLLVLPAMALIVLLLMTIVSRFPAAFNFPVRVTPANRAQLESIALDMIAWLRLEVVAIFALIQRATIASTEQGKNALSSWLLPGCLVCVFGTIALHVVAMFRVRPHASSKGTLSAS
jgi:hypothetical protein